MKRSDNLLPRRARAFFAFVLAAALFPPSLPAAAYERQEATAISGGTEVSVYAGTRNSVDLGNDPENAGDYLRMSRFWTPGRLESTSNVASSLNFVRETAPDSYTICGGVGDVSWDAATGTLTLDNASGTVITIEGPELDAAALNTDPSSPSTVINCDIPNLTYFKQYDLSAAASIIKENSTVQDVVTVRIEGENFFSNIRLRGNVKVIFTGGGTLTLEAGGEWNYDDASGSALDPLSQPSAYAISSLPTVGWAGSVKGTASAASTMPDGSARTITEDFEYRLPDIDLNGVQIITGGTIQNSQPVKDESYFTVSGETAPTDAGRRASYIGTDGVPAQTVVFRGGADIAAARSQNVSPSAQKLILDGRTIVCRKYNIDDENFFKLRDLAYLLTGTPSAFSVEYDEARELIVIVTGAKYRPDGSELDPEPAEGSTASPTLQSIQVDGRMIGGLTAYSIDGSNYFKLRELSALLGFGVDYIASDDAAIVRSDPAAKEGAVLRYIVNNMGTDTTVMNAQYDGYFQEGSTAAGVRAILDAGRFYVNGFAIPATEEELEKNWPDGWKINGETVLQKSKDGKYTAGRDIYDTYAEAACAVAEQLPDGLELALLDSDGDGFADRIENKYYGAVIVGSLTENVGLFSEGGETIAYVDPNVREGGMALLSLREDGWYLTAPVEISGLFVDGAEGEYYQIDGTRYDDADFPQDNILISNRCGELLNAHRYFGFLNNGDGLKVSLWLIPTQSGIAGAPAGFTTGGNAKIFLTRAIAAARTKLDAAGETADALESVIARAREVLASDAAPELMDYQVHLLYLALRGA